MTGGRRGQLLLVAQRPGPPLGPPPKWLSAEEVQAWHDVVAAAPDVLRDIDDLAVALVAHTLERWRSGIREPELLRLAYRMLGDCFVPMRARRRLLFPDRPPRR
jgi:hypothetical protein